MWYINVCDPSENIELQFWLWARLFLVPQSPDYSRQITTQTTTIGAVPQQSNGGEGGPGIKGGDDLPSLGDAGGGGKNTNMTVLEDSKISASDIEDVEKGCA